MNDYIKIIEQCEDEITRLNEACIKDEESVRHLQRVYRDKLSHVENILRENVSRYVG